MSENVEGAQLCTATGLDRSQKRALGAACKRILDTSRVKAMQARGYNARLVRYTTQSVENGLIIATRE